MPVVQVWTALQRNNGAVDLSPRTESDSEPAPTDQRRSRAATLCRLRWLQVLSTGVLFAIMYEYVSYRTTTSAGRDISPGNKSETNHSARTKQAFEFSCVWYPNDDDPCVSRLVQRLQAKFQGTVALSQRRLIFMGDSTVALLFRVSPLLEHLVAVPSIRTYCPQYPCFEVHSGRCDTIDKLKIPRRHVWLPPNLTLGEGPVGHGLENPYCQDCSGCASWLLTCHNREANISCQINNIPQGGVYGGYISVEFARDVEIQSNTSTTTQQSLVQYLERDWNTDEMKADFGRPICVVSTGLHDMLVPNTTLAVYLANVQWYVRLLLTVCDHIIWVSNTCPQTDDYKQGRELVKEWNRAAGAALLEVDQDKISSVDVFPASVDHAHTDNIHMDSTWYDLLGKMLLKVLNGA